MIDKIGNRISVSRTQLPGYANYECHYSSEEFPDPESALDAFHDEIGDELSFLYATYRGQERQYLEWREIADTADALLMGAAGSRPQDENSRELRRKTLRRVLGRIGRGRQIHALTAALIRFEMDRPLWQQYIAEYRPDRPQFEEDLRGC